MSSTVVLASAFMWVIRDLSYFQPSLALYLKHTVTYWSYSSSSPLVSLWRKRSRLCGFREGSADNGPSQHQQDVEPSSWGVAGQQACAHEVNPPLQQCCLFSWQAGKTWWWVCGCKRYWFWNGQCMTFPPCWYFMIRLKWSPEVTKGEFPLKTPNPFPERFSMCLWNH